MKNNIISTLNICFFTYSKIKETTSPFVPAYKGGFKNIFFQIALVVFSFISCLSITSCSSVETRPPDPVLEEETITSQKGNSFKVILDVQMGTGFLWTVKSSEGFILNSKPRIESSKSAKPEAGKNEKMIFEFKAIESGIHKIIFEYRQLWGKDIFVGKIKIMTVDVK